MRDPALMAIRAIPDRDDTAVSESALHSLWGIGHLPLLWGAPISILFVIDGRITESSDPAEFGLGQVLETLRNQWFAWWVRFSVEVVRRDPPQPFRFTQDSFDIDEFDQIWFFGDMPGPDADLPEAGDDLIDLMGDDELKILAEWMERGGGVFATGDHSLLGASMCSRIPRVRTMRKWTRAQGVPSFADEDRHETLVRTAQGRLAQEGDRWPQTIYPVWRYDSTPPFSLGRFPHPLLCGESGVIDHFPDHMHEGGVFEDADVVLNKPLGIAGFDGVEYPTAPIVIGPTHPIDAGLIGGPGPLGRQPRPHVVAHGLTTNSEAAPERFGMISAYDGEIAGVGRVVVDSTWHHWFSWNLFGFQNEAPAYYRGMQNYYRNVGLWLSRPEQRASMLFAATWGVLAGSAPGAFSKAMSIWEIGERVVDVLDRTAPQCIVSELVSTFSQSGPADEPAAGRRRVPSLMPAASTVNQAIVGGIASGMLGTAHRLFIGRARDRRGALENEAIRRGGLEGLAAGKLALSEALAEGATAFADLARSLSDDLGTRRLRDIPIGDAYEDHVHQGP